MLKKYPLYIILTVLFLSCENEDPVPVEIVDMKNSILIEINKLRVTGCTCGDEKMPSVPPLVSNSILTETAINYSHDMYNRNYFSHISPEGTSPIQRAATLGYSGTYVGEVIARNYKTPEEVVEGWKNSTEHCKAIMSSNYTEMGAGKTGAIWVTNLGK